MVHDDDWYDDSPEDESDSIVDTAYDVPLYDEDGNEIPDEELPWNTISDETDSDDETNDWQYDDFDPDEPSSERKGIQDDRPASERRKRVAQSIREEALRRLELSARTTTDFYSVV